MNNYKILKHTQLYAKTRFIHESLVRYFDQNGKWMGDKVTWSESLFKLAQSRMQCAFLPSSRRTRRCRSGTVLRTSFFSNSGSTVTMTYCEVEGSFVVPSDVIIHAACLRRIRGGIYTQSSNLVSIPNLVSVNGDFLAPRTHYIHAPRLRVIEGNAVIAGGYVLHRLQSVRGCYSVGWALDWIAPKLVHAGEIHLHKSCSIVAPMLKFVCQDFISSNSTMKADLPELQSVGGTANFGTISDLTLPLLTAVGGDLDTHSAEGFYHPLTLGVGGEWIAHPKTKADWHRRHAARLAICGSGAIEI